jgi:hypothetical protein
MKSNEELQKKVVDAINWEPLLNTETYNTTKAKQAAKM